MVKVFVYSGEINSIRDAKLNIVEPHDTKENRPTKATTKIEENAMRAKRMRTNQTELGKEKKTEENNNNFEFCTDLEYIMAANRCGHKIYSISFLVGAQENSTLRMYTTHTKHFEWMHAIQGG